MGFALSLCRSVVEVQDLFASPVWESEVCENAKPETRYTAIANCMIMLKPAAREAFVMDILVIFTPGAFGVQLWLFCASAGGEISPKTPTPDRRQSRDKVFTWP